MKRNIVICLGCALIALLPPLTATAQTIVKVGLYQNQPLSFVDRHGRAQGIFSDVLDYVAEQENWLLEYHPEPWSQCLDDLKSGRLDILAAIAYSRERNLAFDFNYENVLSNWGQIYINRAGGIESILDLADRKIAVLQNDIYYADLKALVAKFGFTCRFIEAFEYEDILMLVESGRCDAGLVNYLYGRQHDRRFDVLKSTIVLSPQKIHFAVPKGKNREIINALDSHLRRLKAHPHSVFHRSFRKWIGAETTPIDHGWIVGVGVGAAGLVAIFLIVNLLLKSQINRRIRELDDKNHALLHEIRQRKEAENALHENEREYRSLFENTGTATVIIDESMIVSKVNAKAEELSGFTKAEIEGRMKALDFLAADEFDRITSQVIEQGVGSHSIPAEHSFQMLDKNGKSKTVIIQISLIPGTKKSIASFIDISSRVEAEEALRKSEEKYRKIIENIEEGYIELDLKGNITFFNQSLRKITGLAEEDILGINYIEFASGETADRMFRVFNRIYSTGQSITKDDFEIELKNGRSMMIDLSASAITDDDGRVTGFRGLMRDVSERKRAEAEKMKLEQQLLQAQKMKAIGTLAGGVAHDLNNILSGIVSYPDLLLMDLPADSPLVEPIRTIQQSGKKAAAIVQDLLTLARRGVSVSEVINLNDIILEYRTSPQLEKLQSFHPFIDLKFGLSPGLLNMVGSPFHLSKTVMNLVSNAAEAMPEGGTIEVDTENRFIDVPITGYEEVAAGDYVVLTVSDSGIGIAPEEINRIFEPFYTKKVMGRSGTGLGMAVVWGAVKDHDGYIHVESDPGKGTTFHLYFPATCKAQNGQAASLSLEHIRGHGETILVVDDVREQREIASRILTQLGYSVETAASGEMALKYLKMAAADLVVLDMIMPPGMDGLETYRRILAMNPEQRAIIASGFSETYRVREAQRLGAGKYVKKPYTVETIGLAVRSEFDRADRAA